MIRARSFNIAVGLGVPLLLAITGRAEPPTTWDCGNEGEAPCDAQTDFFWDNGNLFCDRGLKATGFRVLPDITFNAYDWTNLNRADMTKAVKLINEDLPALRARLNELSQDDFLSPVCLGIEQGGECWTTLPVPGTAGTWIQRCYADPAGITLGIPIGGDCWATPPIDQPGIEVCIPGFPCSPCAPVGIGEIANCTSHIPGTSGFWFTRCFADPAGVIAGIEQGGQCWATPPIPGIPGATVPVPDFGKPGWHVPEDIAVFLVKATEATAMFPSVVKGIPGVVPSLAWDPSDFSVDPNLFNLSDFQAQLGALKSFFDQPFFTLFPDLINDFVAPPGVCVNDTRRQPLPEAFRQGWAYWALRDQRELSAHEPLNWVTTIGAHNAFNNAADGYIAPNHRYSCTDLLNLGARNLALDLHWFNGQLRLCHGQANHSGCGTLDRYYSNVIKEIRNWLDANPSEVIWIGFEDRSDGHDSFVDDPIALYLGDKVYRPDHPLGLPGRIAGGDIDAGSRWPTLAEMRGLGKQVIISGGEAHGGGWIWTDVPGNSFSSSKANVFGHDDRYLLGWGEYDDAGTLYREYLSPIDNQDRFILGANSIDQYEARSFLDPFEASGYITAAGMVDMVRINVPKVHLDMIQAQEDTSQCPAAGPEVCDPPDRRLEMAVWSWKPGEPAHIDQYEVAALLDGADGRRWESAHPGEAHYFACSRRRVGDAQCWPDRAGLRWRITEGTGDWTQGCDQCLAEFGPGWVFAAPVNGWQAERLREAVQTFMLEHNLSDADVWLRHKVADFTTSFVDCNRSGTPDDCDIASGNSLDLDGNQVPDECEGSFADLGADPPVPGAYLDVCYADFQNAVPGIIEQERCWSLPPSLAIPLQETCIPPLGCFCFGVTFEGQCYLVPPDPGEVVPECFTDTQRSAPGIAVDGACYVPPLANTTGVAAAVFSGPPDDNYSGIGGQWVMYDLGDRPVINGSGPDFNVYEVDVGTPEFGNIDVLVSADAIHFVSVKGTEGPVIPILGDVLHGDRAYARSYDIGPSNLAAVRYIAIDGSGSAAAGPQAGFDLDAIGVIRRTPGPVRCDVQADFDQDGDVDGDDATAFVACATAGSIGATTDCLSRDFDGDRDVDQADYGAFQRCISGTGILPDPRCAD